jgi:hypothetical protein
VGAGCIALGIVTAVYSFVQYRAIQRDIQAGYIRTYDHLDTVWVIGVRRRCGDVLASIQPTVGLSAK